MIIAWKIEKIVKDGGFFYISPIIKEDENSEEKYKGLSEEEYDNLKTWGFFNADEDLCFWIYKMRQIDILEADFDADILELRKLAEKLKLEW